MVIYITMSGRVYMYMGLNGDIYNYVWTSVRVHLRKLDMINGKQYLIISSGRRTCNFTIQGHHYKIAHNSLMLWQQL